MEERGCACVLLSEWRLPFCMKNRNDRSSVLQGGYVERTIAKLVLSNRRQCSRMAFMATLSRDRSFGGNPPWDRLSYASRRSFHVFLLPSRPSLSLFFSLSPFGSTSSFLFDLPPELSRLDTPSLFLFFSLDASTSDHWLSRPSRFAQSVCPTSGWSVRANDPTDRLVSRTARERNKEFAVHIWNTCLQRSFEYSLLVRFEDRNLRDTV